MRIRTLPASSPSLESVALTDIILNMFIFFFTSFSLIYTFNPEREARIQVNLPRASAGLEQPQAAIVVTVDLNGSVFLDGQPVAAGNLLLDLGKAAAAGRTRTVLVRADRGVAFDRVVEVLDAAGGAGVERLGVAVKDRE